MIEIGGFSGGFPKPKRIRDPKRLRQIEKKWCELCGTTWRLERHHIRPRSLGGDDTEENIIVLCIECHGKAQRHESQLTPD